MHVDKYVCGYCTEGHGYLIFRDKINFETTKIGGLSNPSNPPGYGLAYRKSRGCIKMIFSRMIHHNIKVLVLY